MMSWTHCLLTLVHTLYLPVQASAIAVEEGSPCRRRKIHKDVFHDQVDRDNFWMGQTLKRTEKALKVCDQQDQDMDKEHEQLNTKRQRVKEQREILEDTKEFILDVEQKVSRRWRSS